MTFPQVIALAEFERTYGRAFLVPPGPRRDRVLRWAGFDDALAVQSDASYMEPVVVAISTDGEVEVIEARA